MFATIRGYIPEPRQADQPRNYIGRHRNSQVYPVPTAEPDATPDNDVDVPEAPAEPMATCGTPERC